MCSCLTVRSYCPVMLALTIHTVAGVCQILGSWSRVKCVQCKCKCQKGGVLLACIVTIKSAYVQILMTYPMQSFV